MPRPGTESTNPSPPSSESGANSIMRLGDRRSAVAAQQPISFGFESIQQYSRGDNQWPGDIDIAAWREAGGSHISVVTMGANLTTVDGHIAAIKRWRDVFNSVG
jgi:hypothetical protein